MPLAPDTEGVHPIANTANTERVADVVFVHGLGGSSHKTWRYSKEGKHDHFFWPEELAKELSSCGVWVVGYAAGFTELGNPGMIIEKRGRNIANQLTLSGVGGRPVIFICHSMGGLVVKALITTSLLSEDSNHKRLVSSIRGLVFCCTPHRGAALATAASVLALLLGGTQDHVKQMHGHSEQLDLLHSQFLAWHRDHPIAVEAYAENVGLYRKGFWGRLVPLGKAVERDSANPSIGTLHDVDGDHLQVVKPSPAVPAIHTPVYRGVLRFVNGVLDSLVSAPSEAASNDAPNIRSLILDILREEGLLPAIS